MVADIIDFPTARIKRVLFLERMRMTIEDQQQAFEYVRDLLREGFPAREAVALALESIPCH